MAKKKTSKKKTKLKKNPKPKVKKKKKKPKIKRKYSKSTSKFVKDAPAGKQFVLCNGERFRNIKQLAMAIDKLDDSVFCHHVTSYKNDFAKWIYDVFKDAKLAKALGRIKDKKAMRKKIYKHFGEKY